MLNKLKWLVVPGGPGLSNQYMKEGLEGLFPKEHLLFFNQLGTPDSEYKNPSINELVEQIKTLCKEISDKKEEFGIISHSFGNYLTIRALETEDIKPCTILMLHPMPLKKDEWLNSLNNIQKKIPKKSTELIVKLSTSAKDGSQLFKELFPYYVYEKNISEALIIPNSDFDVVSCNKISASVEDFNHYTLLKKFDIPYVRIVGENDPFYVDKGLFSDSTVTIPECGHFSFFEKKESLKDSLKKAEEILYLKIKHKTI